MNTTTHPVAPEEVMALLDGELQTERKESVARHVEQCPECAALATQFRDVCRTLNEWKVTPISQKLQVNILESAQRRSSDGRIGGPSLFLRLNLWDRKQWSVGLVATTAAVALMILLFVPNRVMRTANSRNKAEVVPLSISPYEGKSHAVHEVPQKSAPIDGRTPEYIAKLPADALATVPGNGGGAGGGYAPRSSTTTANAVMGVGSGSGAGVGARTRLTFGAVATEQGDQLTSGPMIARTVSLTLVVKDFAAARAMMDAILARRHAYAADLTVNTAEGAPRNLAASLRVPAPELASALSELKSLGRVENEAQSGEEVTQQHADLVARLKNSRETEQRLQAILQERTGKIGDVLAVEQEIARVRGGIEQMEAEQKSLEHRVDFAAVDLSLSEVYKAQLVPPAVSFGTRLHNGLVAGYHNAAESVFGTVLFFAEGGPTLLIWLFILGLPVLFLWRRYRRAVAAV